MRNVLLLVFLTAGCSPGYAAACREKGLAVVRSSATRSEAELALDRLAATDPECAKVFADAGAP